MVTISQSSAASRRTRAEPTRPRCPATHTRLLRSSNRFEFDVIDFALLQFPEIRSDHFLHQLVESRFVAPAQLLARFFGIADQQVDFRVPVIGGIYGDEHVARSNAVAFFLGLAPLPDDPTPNMTKCALDEFANRMRFSGRENVVVRFGLLQDAPHALDIVPRMAPVSLGAQVSEIETLLKAEFDRGDGACDFAGDEGLAADG